MAVLGNYVQDVAGQHGWRGVWLLVLYSLDNRDQLLLIARLLSPFLCKPVVLMMTLTQCLNSCGTGQTCRVSDSIPDLISFMMDPQPGSYPVLSAWDHWFLPRLMLMH